MNKFVCLVLLVLFLCNDALAQLVDGESPPLLIEGIRQASGVCRKDNLVRPEKKMRQQPRVSFDYSCAVNINAVEALLKRQDTMLVDLRSASDFATFHALNAINISARELRYKSHFRNKTLLLLGGAKAEDELYEECSRLSQLGFRDVKVVRGGMPMWLVHQLPSAGRQVSSAQLVRLGAVELWQESLNPLNLLLILNSQADLRSEFPNAKVLQDFSFELIQSAINRRGSRVAAIVVIGEELSDTKIELLQRALKPVPLMVYTDGNDIYKRDISLQKSMWSAHESGPKQLGCGL